MGEVVNFRRARKARDRAVAGRVADANRAKFGRTKAERAAADAEAARIERTLDGAKLED
ncbi:MAG: DUF4169 family protein [Sphingomonas aquatilis]|jgi:hypothetical protein|uniref:DUF4169 family protein n=1 Tax=Sphingomonas aquatilis TaxID=93063 RepID=UPI0025D7A809|nr:DUF4169 family protein [uncultured Sphingomonas sp.]